MLFFKGVVGFGLLSVVVIVVCWKGVVRVIG